jgi:peptide/nickel transport system permease protein
MRKAATLRLILQRLALAVPMLLGVVVLNSALIQLAPGDPATILVGDFPAPPAYVAQVRHQFGLDQPIPVRILRYVEQVLHGNLGYSFANRQPVGSLILDRLGATLELTLTALALASVLGILLGIIAARRPGGRLDMTVQTVSLAGYSLPEFWLGQLLILGFSLWLRWLPAQGAESLRGVPPGFAGFLDHLRYLVLPVTALALRYLALIARVTRTSMLEVLSADYILAVRARGASERMVLFAHALRNAAAPVLNVIGYNLGFVLGGSALIETVFGWPGIGRLLFDSISARDYPVMMGILLLISASVVMANLLTDLIHRLIDPRIERP